MMIYNISNPQNPKTPKPHLLRIKYNLRNALLKSVSLNSKLRCNFLNSSPAPEPSPDG